jgi:hypothetical protein
MSNQDEKHTRTESIEILTSKFDSFAKEIRQSIDSMKETVDMHSKEIWGTSDDNIGIKAKVRDITEERKREREGRTYWRAAVGVPVIGLIIDRLSHFFKT